MKSQAQTVEQYIADLPANRQKIIQQIRTIVNQNLPVGFQEEMNYGMIGWVVPHSIYPAGYHCDTKLPLPYINLASQKKHITLYHMGIYANKDLLTWFEQEYPKHSNLKLNMGKSCIRFKKAEHVPLNLIGELAKKMSVKEWVSIYEKNVIKK